MRPKPKNTAKYKNLFPWIVFAHQIVSGWIGNPNQQGKNFKIIWCAFPFVKRNRLLFGQYWVETEIQIYTKYSTFKRQINLDMSIVQWSLWIVLSSFYFPTSIFYLPTHSYNAKEGPVRIQYKCIVPIYVLPEMKLPGHIMSKTEL